MQSPCLHLKSWSRGAPAKYIYKYSCIYSISEFAKVVVIMFFKTWLDMHRSSDCIQTFLLKDKIECHVANKTRYNALQPKEVNSKACSCFQSKFKESDSVVKLHEKLKVSAIGYIGKIKSEWWLMIMMTRLIGKMKLSFNSVFFSMTAESNDSRKNQHASPVIIAIFQSEKPRVSKQ